MYFQGWPIIIETVSLSTIMYIAIIIVLRTSGKRTLSSFNAFDFLITVTIGSITATIILSKNTKLFDGLAAITTLILLQFIVAKLAVYSKTFSKVIKSNPTLLFYNGEYIIENLKKTRVSKDDILQEVRINSGVTIDHVHSVILEANGNLAVVTNGSDENLKDLFRYK